MKIEFVLTRQEAVVLCAMAEELGADPQPVAKLIFYDWLVRRGYLPEPNPERGNIASGLSERGSEVAFIAKYDIDDRFVIYWPFRPRR